jgi:hypothetical protein
MPLRAEIRKLYGPAHRAYRAQLIAIYGPRCMACGAAVTRYLQLAHTTHDPKDAAHVALWCASCHARSDATRNAAVRRRTRARREGQLWLLPEIEWAPFPSWEWPRRVIRAAQEVLF